MSRISYGTLYGTVCLMIAGWAFGDRIGLGVAASIVALAQFWSRK